MKTPTIDLRHADCMDMMREFPDKHFELAIVDPPYGIGVAKRNGSIGQKKGQGIITNYTSKKWDDNIPPSEYFTEIFRVSKEQIIWGGNYFTASLPPAMGWIVWDKRQPEGVTFAMAELAFCSIKKSCKIFSCSRAMIGNKISNNKQLARLAAKIHPTQKPVALYKWLLKNYAKEGDKILDTHGGSMSIAIACWDMGFDLTLSELDADYYAAGVKRFEQHKSQMKLF